MNKKGFVLLESIVVLVVVALSLSVLMTTFSLVSRKTEEKEYYDRSSDKYLLYSIMNLGTDDNCNYWSKNVTCNSTSFSDINFQVSGSTCVEKNGVAQKVGKIIPHCNELFQTFGISHLYVVNDIKSQLASDDLYELYDYQDGNGVIEYMKTLKKCADCEFSDNGSCDYPIPYMIGEFVRGGRTYYASVTFSELDDGICCKAGSGTDSTDPNYAKCSKIMK